MTDNLKRSNLTKICLLDVKVNQRIVQKSSVISLLHKEKFLATKFLRFHSTLTKSFCRAVQGLLSL